MVLKNLLQKVKHEDMSYDDYENDISKCRTFVWDQWYNYVDNMDVFEEETLQNRQVDRLACQAICFEKEKLLCNHFAKHWNKL